MMGGRRALFVIQSDTLAGRSLEKISNFSPGPPLLVTATAPRARFQGPPSSGLRAGPPTRSMPPPNRMFILKKIFQLRDHSSTDSEKPFLEHLEDLRNTLMKIIMTLIAAMIACFSLNGKMMEVLRAPVEKVTRLHEEELMPKKGSGTKDVTVDTWEQAKKIEQAAPTLSKDELDKLYLATGDEPALRFHVKSVSLLRATLALPEAKRETYLNSIEGNAPGLPSYTAADMQKQVRALIAAKATPVIDTKGSTMSTLKPTESFMLSMKLAFFAGIVVSFPLLLYFILQFVLPGLHGHERRVLWPALAIGFGLFIVGVLFAYCFVLPRTLLFLSDWGKDMGISNDWRIGEYVSFASQFALLFGASFELPVVVMVAVKLGLLTYETMRRTRRYAILAIVVLVAVLSPTPDIPTQLLMAAPMVILYEICIWLAWWDERKKKKAEEAEARERMEQLLLKNPDVQPYAHPEDEHMDYPAHYDDRTHDVTVMEDEVAGDHPEPPVEHDPDLLPPPTTQEEPRQE